MSKFELDQQIYRQLIQSSSDCILLIDETGKVLYANRACDRVFNGKPNLLIGQKIQDFVNVPKELNSLENLLQCNSETLNNVTKNIPPVTVTSEAGKTLYYEIAINLLENKQEKIFSVTAHDVTSRITLKQEKSLYQNILIEALEAIPDGFVIYDEQDRMVVCNNAYKEIYKTSAPALKEGNSFEDIVRYGVERGQYPQAGDTDKSREDWIAERVNAHLNPAGEIIQQTDEGRWLKIDERKTINNYIVGIRSDVTQIKNAEEALIKQAEELHRLVDENQKAKKEAEAATQAKSNFLAIISHELRTPMTGVLGLCDLLLDSELQPLQENQLKNLKASGETLLTLLNNILDYSKFEAGQLSFEKISFDFKNLIKEVLDLMKANAEQKNLILQCEFSPEDRDFFYLSDATRIRQVVLNFVANAIKFTESGTITIRLTQENKPEQLLLEVIDTGIGIDPEHGEKLFAPFTQADETTTRKFGGTGLGLAICKMIINGLGGQIGYHGDQEMGSTFYFRLELEPCQKLKKAPSPITSSAITGRFKFPSSLQILLVEDNKINRTVIASVLKGAGHIVVEAHNGQEAVQYFEKESFDIILMDMQMPVMDGRTATKQIRKIDPDIPIIALTADVLAAENKDYIKAGITAFATKPVDWQKLECLFEEVTR